MEAEMETRVVNRPPFLRLYNWPEPTSIFLTLLRNNRPLDLTIMPPLVLLAPFAVDAALA